MISDIFIPVTASLHIIMNCFRCFTSYQKSSFVSMYIALLKSFKITRWEDSTLEKPILFVCALFIIHFTNNVIHKNIDFNTLEMNVYPSTFSWFHVRRSSKHSAHFSFLLQTSVAIPIYSYNVSIQVHWMRAVNNKTVFEYIEFISSHSQVLNPLYFVPSISYKPFII